MALKTLNFTKKSIETCPIPVTAREEYYDTQVRGLMLRVTSSGVKTFYVYRWFRGKPWRVSIGRWPDLTVDQARRQAEQVISDLVQGKQPKPRGAAPTAKTLADLFESYMEEHSVPHKRTSGEDRRQFEKYVVSMSGLPLNAITNDKIVALHLSLGENHGHYAANRVLALLHTVLAFGKRKGHVAENVASGVKRFKEKERERFLSPGEVSSFFDALATEDNDVFRRFVLMCILTGARRSKVQSMRWDEIDMLRCTWRMEDTKNSESHTIPLVEAAKELLLSTPKVSEWVFPGRLAGTHLKSPYKTWQKLIDRAAIKNLRIHDLRRTLGSWQAAQHDSLLIIGRTLGHKSHASTQVYAKLQLDPVRESMEKATQAILSTASRGSGTREPDHASSMGSGDGDELERLRKENEFLMARLKALEAK